MNELSTVSLSNLDTIENDPSGAPKLISFYSTPKDKTPSVVLTVEKGIVVMASEVFPTRRHGHAEAVARANGFLLSNGAFELVI